MAANYDNTTWFYERLSKLVFGQAQVKAQTYFLGQVPAISQVLIIGGGTGQILERLARLHPAGLHITYVEISAKMMALSRQRDVGSNQVSYITASIEEISFTDTFDVVITAFLFDNFSEEDLAATFPLINARVKPGGLWLNTDFQLTGPLWQKVMLKGMYTFFKLMGAVEVTWLPDTRRMFRLHGYQIYGEKTFYGNFIWAAVYRKQPDLKG
jgi:ubiquinone/menaquinone biosynthesis C-methylase UbiE